MCQSPATGEEGLVTTERRVIFVPDDYWTNPPKENNR